jgi:hypothetical protein
VSIRKEEINGKRCGKQVEGYEKDREERRVRGSVEADGGELTRGKDISRMCYEPKCVVVGRIL